jgi:hypothetical protein
VPSSAPDLDALGKDDCSSKPGLHNEKEKDVPDVLFFFFEPIYIPEYKPETKPGRS